MRHRQHSREDRLLLRSGVALSLFPLLLMLSWLGYRELNSLPQLEHAQAYLSMIELKAPSVERLPYCVLNHTGLDEVQRQLCDHHMFTIDWDVPFLSVDTTGGSGRSDGP